MRGVARKRVKILNPSLLSQGRRVSWRLGRILGVYVELGANPNAKNRWCGRSFLLKVPQCPEDAVDWGLRGSEDSISK